MKILVLGGTSYFGKHLVDTLAAEGHKVSVASSGKTQVTFKAPVERLKIDRNDSASLRAACQGRSWDIVYDQICFDEVAATLAIETFGSRIGHLVLTSSQSVYGPGAHICEADFAAESYAGNPHNENAYQEGKRLAERAYARQKLFPVTAVRFSIVLGPDDPRERLRWHVARVQQGEPIYFPKIDAELSFIRSFDAAACLSRLKETRLMGPLNVASPEPVRLRDLMAIVARRVGKSLIAPPEATDTNHSPFGVGDDWYMKVERASQAGFALGNTQEWLTKMIDECAEATAEAVGDT